MRVTVSKGGQALDLQCFQIEGVHEAQAFVVPQIGNREWHKAAA